MLVMVFEDDVYEPGPVDDYSKMVLSGTLRPSFVGQAANQEVQIWGELSSAPGGIAVMVDWLRKNMAQVSAGAATYDVGFPPTDPRRPTQ